MSLPTPEQPVPGFQSGYPIVAALDLLGRRWILRILWELRNGPIGFRALQAFCDSNVSQHVKPAAQPSPDHGADLPYRGKHLFLDGNGPGTPASARAFAGVGAAVGRAVERTGRNRARTD